MTFSIHLYLDEQNETSIASFYDMQSDPFSVGDEITLAVDDIVRASLPSDPVIADEIIKRNKSYSETFNGKKVKLVRKQHYFRTDKCNFHFLTIEYHCRFV